MGKQRVYGKKTKVPTLASYSKFTADSSGSEILADPHVFSHIAVDIKPVRQSLRSEILEDVSIPSHITIDIEPVRIAATRSSNDVGQSQKSHRIRSKSAKTSPLSPTIANGQSRHQKSKDHEKNGDVIIDDNKLAWSCSSFKSRAKTEACYESQLSITEKSSQKVGQPSMDDLSTVFANFGLRTFPESSILGLQPTYAVTNTDPEIISPAKKSYLRPILCCKNVTPDISDFSSWVAARTHLALEKVGEGSFGEVFRAASPDGEAVILKLMPLNAMKGRGSKSFTSVDSAANEIRLLERMQRVPGFVEFRGACVLVGSLPETFIDLWKEYKSSGRTVESRDPSKKTSYSTDQLWLLIEMSDAGRNLEPGQYAPPGEISIKGQRYLGIGRAWDIFWEVVKSVAKAECWAQFEHRDLHMGNICARDTIDIPDQEDLTFVSTIKPAPIRINITELEITIIDYSLSRAYMEREEDVLFYDIKKDKHILKGEGDLQYDMYRYMAAAIGQRSCKEFVPETNVVWLWYLLNRILAMTKPLSNRAKAKKRGLVTREARKLSILEQIQEMIRPGNMEKWTINSAAALLSDGVEQGWLLADDVTR